MTMESEELSIRGSLSESSLPELLASISRSKETGILNFHDAGRWKAIYFKEGPHHLRDVERPGRSPGGVPDQDREGHGAAVSRGIEAHPAGQEARRGPGGPGNHQPRRSLRRHTPARGSGGLQSLRLDPGRVRVRHQGPLRGGADGPRSRLLQRDRRGHPPTQGLHADLRRRRAARDRPSSVRRRRRRSPTS